MSRIGCARLEAIIKDRNSSRKAVGRTDFVLATADGHGTKEKVGTNQHGACE